MVSVTGMKMICDECINKSTFIFICLSKRRMTPRSVKRKQCPAAKMVGGTHNFLNTQIIINSCFTVFDRNFLQPFLHCFFRLFWLNAIKICLRVFSQLSKELNENKHENNQHDRSKQPNVVQVLLLSLSLLFGSCTSGLQIKIRNNYFANWRINKSV